MVQSRSNSRASGLTSEEIDTARCGRAAAISARWVPPIAAGAAGGIEIVLIPSENERELTEIPKNIKQNLDIRPVRWIDEVLEVALQRMPEPAGENTAAEIVKKDEVQSDTKTDLLRPH